MFHTIQSCQRGAQLSIARRQYVKDQLLDDAQYMTICEKCFLGTDVGVQVTSRSFVATQYCASFIFSVCVVLPHAYVLSERSSAFLLEWSPSLVVPISCGPHLLRTIMTSLGQVTVMSLEWPFEVDISKAEPFYAVQIWSGGAAMTHVYR